MKEIMTHLRPAAASTGVLLVVLCGIYPMAVWGVGQLVFQEKANGSLVTDQDGTVRGSALIAQRFVGEGYFHPRPSMAGSSGYDGASSGGSNLGPTSRKLADQIRERVVAYRKLNELPPETPVPADAATASSSGLDPHISPQNAELQSSRIAKARNLPKSEIDRLVRTHTLRPGLGVLGNPCVHVLELNRALDALKP